MSTHRGSCHCGAVRFEADGELVGLEVCNCSLCARNGYIHWYVSPERFRLLTPWEAIETYEHLYHYVDDEDAKKLFELLLEEEKKHLKQFETEFEDMQDQWN